jgi:hypothetical protein
MAQCKEREPELANVDGRLVACHLYASGAAQSERGLKLDEPRPDSPTELQNR